MQLHWHRTDLRARDNIGLSEAADAGSVVPVFVFDEALIEQAGPPRIVALLDALKRLRAWYRDHGSDLVIARGDPETRIPELAAEFDAKRVTYNRSYSKAARERDAAVRQALDETGVARASFHDAVHHEPGSITTNAGEPYSVYTYYWKKWRDRPKKDPRAAPTADALASVHDDTPLPSRTVRSRPASVCRHSVTARFTSMRTNETTQPPNAPRGYQPT